MNDKFIYIDCNKCEIDEFDSIFELAFQLKRHFYDTECLGLYERTWMYTDELQCRARRVKSLIKHHNLPVANPNALL